MAIIRTEIPICATVDENENSVFSVNFANAEDGADIFSSSLSMSCSSTFVQNGQTYRLSAIVSLIAVTQSYDVLIKLLPFIAVMILLISVIGAFVCYCKMSAEKIVV